MSEQSRSNFQAFGAGLLGFIAVMAVGGGVLMLHSSRRASPKPVPAAEPIDLATATPLDPTVPAAPFKERRLESPAPLIGSDDEAEIAGNRAAPAAAASIPAPAFSPENDAKAMAAAVEDAAIAERRLKPGEHLDATGHSSAAAVVAKDTPAGRKAAKAAAAKKPAAKLAPVAAPAASIASVHYGVTSRDELMGRAAGPVYNIKGASASPKSKPEERGKMASDMNARLADLQSRLDGDTNLTPAQRADIQKELADVKKGVADVGGSR
jgi:hypothetical protein